MLTAKRGAGTVPAHMRIVAALVLGLLVAPGARADDVLHPGAALLDRPTVVTFGVQLLVSGDDDHDAQVSVRYRPAGTSTWRDGLPLFRVRPESVVGRTVPEQFAGTIFDLAPATSYDVELRATDPDGPVDVTVPLAATTRAVPPADPVAPTVRPVSTTAQLSSALAAAAPGDVITLANGLYAGPFTLSASGTAANPIVIRGASTDGVVLDGGGCGSCNVLEVYGSFVHVERLTFRNATRALRFQTAGAEQNVVRRVRITDVRLGIGSRQDQRDFYLCDNVVEGRLVWPLVYTDDGGAQSDDDGIRVEGHGHVVCHNQLAGFGDALKIGQAGARAVDFYGNEVLSAYDNGLELDGSEGNTRAFRNRFTNTFATLSFQPIYGGPAYAIRNVVVNVADEQLKFHGLGTGQEPSGILVLHNTFVRPGLALNVQTTATSHHFLVANNLFVGPSPPGARVVDWTGGIDGGTFDWNGWFPDGRFDFGAAGDWPSFAAMQAAGTFETNGRLLAAPVFASGLVPPTTFRTTMAPADASLASASNALDAALALPNVSDAFEGAGPDLGALERGCPPLLFGVRPEGIDETNGPTGCGGPVVTVTTSTSTTSTTLPWILIRTTSFGLRDDSTPPPNPDRRKISFVSATRTDPTPNRIVPPGPGTAGDPTVGGGTLSVYNAAGSPEAVSVVLPSTGWTRLGSPSNPKGYRYRAAGPITSVVVRPDRLTVKGGRAAWAYTLDEAAQGRVGLRLVLGTERPWCAEAPAKLTGNPPSTATTDRVDAFVGAPRTPPPASCPPVP